MVKMLIVIVGEILDMFPSLEVFGVGMELWNQTIFPGGMIPLI